MMRFIKLKKSITTFLAIIVLNCISSCAQKQSIEGNWIRVYDENLTGFNSIEEKWTFTRDSVYSKVIIDSDSIAYENGSKYSIDYENEILMIRITDEEQEINRETQVRIKILTESKLELLSERNQILEFERKK